MSSGAGPTLPGGGADTSSTQRAELLAKRPQPPARRRTERRSELNGFARAALACLPAGVMLLAPDGRIRWTNRRARQILGRPAAHLRGLPVESVIAPLSSLEQHQGFLDPDRHLDVTLPSGRKVSLSLSLAVPDDGTTGFVLLFENVSHWGRLRDERDRLLKIAAVGDSLPTLLHEIKNPLASISMAVELLAEESPPGHARDQMLAVLAEVKRMRLCLDGVGVVGRRLACAQASPIARTCREAWSIMSARAEAAGIRTRCEIAEMPPLKLDPAVISAIVYNLMINAIQACSTGSTVRLSAGLVDGGASFELRVVDNGPGMTQQVWRRATELFYTTKRNGSGIGLALCKRAAEEAGGSFEIESVPGFGTAVTLRVPVQ